MASNWTPQGWTGFEGRHLPSYPDQAALDAVTKRLGNFPPLVFAGEARALKADPEVTARVPAEALEASFGLDYHFAQVDRIFERVFG